MMYCLSLVNDKKEVVKIFEMSLFIFIINIVFLMFRMLSYIRREVSINSFLFMGWAGFELRVFIVVFICLVKRGMIAEKRSMVDFVGLVDIIILLVFFKFFI